MTLVTALSNVARDASSRTSADVRAARAAWAERWADEPCTWCEGLPDRSGMAAYTHLIRSELDPISQDRREKRARRANPNAAWRAELTAKKGQEGSLARSWAARILRHLRTLQEARTFPWLCLELTGGRYTADVCAGKGPDLGLWLAVERGRLLWRNAREGEPGVVWFATRLRRAPLPERQLSLWGGGEA